MTSLASAPCNGHNAIETHEHTGDFKAAAQNKRVGGGHHRQSHARPYRKPRQRDAEPAPVHSL